MKAAEVACTRVRYSLLLFELNCTKRSRQVVLGTSGKEKLILKPVVGSASAKLDPPKLVDTDHLALRIFYRADKLSGDEIEAVDRAAVGIVRNQQSVAERPEILGRDGKSPRLVQGPAMRECANKGPVLAKDVDVTTRASIRGGKRNEDKTVDVLNSERCNSRRQVGIGE
jgi:hypothetical protein